MTLEIKNPKILNVDPNLGVIFLQFNKDFNASPDNLYYIKTNSRRLNRYNNLFIKLRPVWYYYQDHSTSTKWDIMASDKYTNKDDIIFIRFQILGVYYSLDKTLSKSRLNGFSRVIDDNNYFSQIPLINHLTHWDNGVLSSATHLIKTKWGITKEIQHTTYKTLDRWDNFDLEIETRFNNHVKAFTALEGHRNL